MTREELIDLRAKLEAKHADLKQIGDFDASAATVRMAIETLLKLTDHHLERARK